jgi:phosphoglycolate phosphatase-like HAD superfamily hydrolase
MANFRKIKNIAIDTNGVLLNDVYSGAIQRFVEKHGGVYTSALERLVFGSPHVAGGHIMSLACNLPWSAQETIEAFLAEQADYARSHPVRLQPGAEPFLRLLHATGARVTTYGGSAREVVFDRHCEPVRHLLDPELPYVNMGPFRPGMKEIASRFFHCDYDEILFIDDLNRVGEVAQALGSGFIGVAGAMFQREQMQAAGVTHIVDTLEEIDLPMLLEIDEALQRGTLWPARRAAPRHDFATA